MKLNDYEKMVYKSMLYRKISKLNINNEAKENLINSVIEEAEKKFRHSFSLFLRDILNRKLRELNDNKVPSLNKKEYKLILALKQLDIGMITIDEIDYKNKKEFNTILNQVLNELIKNDEKNEEAIKIYPNIKNYITSKKLSISTIDLKIIKYLNNTKINILNGDDKKILRYKIDYLSKKLDKDLEEIKEVYPNAYITLKLISLGLTIKEVEIFYLLKEDTSIKEKAKKLKYSNYKTYNKAKEKLYKKIKQKKDLRDFIIKDHRYIIDMIEQNEIKHNMIKLKSFNKKNKDIFKKKLIIKKAPRVINISNSCLPYTIITDIRINDIYLNNKGYFINSANLNKSMNKLEEVTQDFKDLTLKERYIIAIKLGYIKTTLNLSENLNIEKKDISKTLCKVLKDKK